MTSSESLDRLFDSIAMRSGQRLVIELSNVQYLPSSILGKLINLKKQLGGRGRLVLHVHPDLGEVFRITGLDRVFDLES